jgi:prolyl oligopeptidase PreP (S9A serine peptidase family)
MEDDRSDETASWVKAQNEVTYGYLNQIPLEMRNTNGEIVELRENRLPLKKVILPIFLK